MPSFYATPLHERFTPVPVRARRDGWTVARQQGFVAALGRGCRVEDAARAVGMSGRTAYRLLDRPGAASFVKAWRMAQELARPVHHAGDPFRYTSEHRWRGRVVHREVHWRESRVAAFLARHDPYRFDAGRRAADDELIDRLTTEAEARTARRDFLLRQSALAEAVRNLSDLSRPPPGRLSPSARPRTGTRRAPPPGRSTRRRSTTWRCRPTPRPPPAPRAGA